MTVAEKLRKRYGVSIIKSAYWNPFRMRFCTDYIIYSADGCKWDNARTLKGCEKICKTDTELLLNIKKRVEV